MLHDPRQLPGNISISRWKPRGIGDPGNRNSADVTALLVADCEPGAVMGGVLKLVKDPRRHRPRRRMGPAV